MNKPAFVLDHYCKPLMTKNHISPITEGLFVVWLEVFEVIAHNAHGEPHIVTHYLHQN